MPRHDWFDNDTNTRERSDYRHSGYGSRDRDFDDNRREGRAFFGSDRDRQFRDHDRDRNRPIGGWGGMMGDDTRTRSRDTERQMDRERIRGRDEDRDFDRNRDRMMDRSRDGDRDRNFGPDDFNRGLPIDETERLIASNKVEGTPVYDRHGDKLGSIHNFMVDKYKGEVVYAVLKHGGGFLGLNERYYPLEWCDLDYDKRLGGFHVQMDEEDLKSVGSFDSEGRWERRRPNGRSERSEDRDRDRGYRGW